MKKKGINLHVDVRTMSPEDKKKFHEDTENARKGVRKTWAQIQQVVRNNFTNGGRVFKVDNSH